MEKDVIELLCRLPRAESLQQINLIVQQLEAQPLVAYCTVNTANSSRITSSTRFSFLKAALRLSSDRTLPASVPGTIPFILRSGPAHFTACQAKAFQ